jgi:hypothetical protein
MTIAVESMNFEVLTLLVPGDDVSQEVNGHAVVGWQVGLSIHRQELEHLPLAFELGGEGLS